MKDNRYLVTLVHGTWAKHAPWTQDGSIFRRTIELGIKKRTTGEVTFTTFEWSGKNTHEERCRASDELALHVRRAHAKHPDFRHYVVAHSHGGNVALRMLRTSDFAQRSVEGLLCLATPFLRFERAHLGIALVPSIMSVIREMLLYSLGNIAIGLQLLWAILKSINPIYIAMYIALSAALLFKFGSEKHVAEDPLIAFSCALFFSEDSCKRGWKLFTYLIEGLVVIYIARGLIYFYRYSVQEAFRRQRRRLACARRMIIRKYGYFQPFFRMAIRLRIYSSSIDEALGALSGSWWMHRSGGLLIRLFIYALIGLAGLAIVLLIAVIYYLIERHGVTNLQFLLIDQMGPQALILLVILISLLMSVFAALGNNLARRLGPGLTFENPEANLLWEVSASRVLPQDYEFEHRRISAWHLIWNSRMALFHSRIYSSQAVVDSIAEWMCRPHQNT